MRRLSLVMRSRKQARLAPLAVESLEGRILLYAVTGNKFTNGQDITISFIPDGTSLGSVTSNLQSTLNNTYGSNSWENAILAAAAYWESYANINFTVVSDNGAAIGSGSYQQGNPNFGDIRIGGYAMNLNTLAYTIQPPPANGDSSSGDIMFNTSAAIGGNGGYDLQTLALHELGHALGLGHSTDSNASMYASYTGTKQAPDQDDVNGVVSLWKTRQPDAYTQKYNNTTLANAVDLTSQVNGYQQIGVPNLDVPVYGKGYWFKYTTAANAPSSFAAIVQSNGYSLLSPQVGIYNGSGTLLGSNTGNPAAYGNTMGIQINNATPNTTYYVKVQGDTTGPNGVGNYALLLNVGTKAPGPVNPTVTTVPVTASQGGGSIAESKHTHATKADPADFTSIGSLQSSGDKFLVSTTSTSSTHKTVVQLKKAHPTVRPAARRQSSVKVHGALE